MAKLKKNFDQTTESGFYRSWSFYRRKNLDELRSRGSILRLEQEKEEVKIA